MLRIWDLNILNGHDLGHKERYCEERQHYSPMGHDPINPGNRVLRNAGIGIMMLFESQLHVYSFIELDLPYSVFIYDLNDIVSWGNYQALCSLIYRPSKNSKAFFQRSVRVVISKLLRSVSRRYCPRYHALRREKKRGEKHTKTTAKYPRR
jgi:hypothetical protein